MRSAICYERDAPLVVHEIEPLPPRDCDVIIRVSVCGLCHSDLSVINGVFPYPLPALLGHEVVGVVEWVGPAVERVVPGQRVILAGSGPHCGQCRACDDEESFCDLTFELGALPRARVAGDRLAAALGGIGGFSDVITVHHASVVAIDSELPDELLAIIGCGVSVGAGAVLNTAKAQAGDTVAIVGCGGVGLAAVQAARLVGASRVIAIDPQAAKREVALRHGATDVLDPMATDPVAAVRELTRGGADVAIEAAGREDTYDQTWRMAKRLGTAVLAGVATPDSRIDLPAMEFFMSGVKLMFTLGSGGNNRRFYPMLVRLAERGSLDLAAFITGRHSLDEVNQALDRVRTGDAIRDVLVMS